MSSTRRAALAGLLLPALWPVASRATGVVRIGYQKNGSFVIMRKQATLEAALAPLGVGVQWVEFFAGPPIMEAINAGAIDVAATGDTPPIFAQAAGTDIVYIGAQPQRGDSQAVLVREGGPATLADLKGKRVAFTRGSSAHYLTICALASAGLTLADVQQVPLAPSDAAAAFRAGSIDAWAIWDPFLAIAEQDPATRVLAQGMAVDPSSSFILARRAWADAAPAQVPIVLNTINTAAAWAKTHPEDLAALMASVTGVPLAAQRVAAPRGVYAVQSMDAGIIALQQAEADTFTRLRVIPGKVDIGKAVWQPPS